YLAGGRGSSRHTRAEAGGRRRPRCTRTASAPAGKSRYRIERSWLLTYGFVPPLCPRGRWGAIQVCGLEAALANERTLEGQVAIVTGGGRRLGRAMALTPPRDGAARVINAPSSPDQAEAPA